MHVGIGTASPATLLHIVGSGPSPQGRLQNTDDAPVAVDFVTDLETWRISQNQPPDSLVLDAFFIHQAGPNLTRFLALEAGCPGTSEVLRINRDDRRVGIGGLPTAGGLLTVHSDIRIGTGTTGCVTDADGTSIAGTRSSDLRFKRDIKPFPETLEKLAQLQPVSFHWRAEEFPNRGFGASESFGLIAQQVEETLPELVTKDAEGYKAVRYNKLPLLLLQALKELKAQNDELRARVEQLERRANRQPAAEESVAAATATD